MKIANAEPVEDHSICEISNGKSDQEVKSGEAIEMILAKPLPDDVTPDQKEKFFALMAHLGRWSRQTRSHRNIKAQY